MLSADALYSTLTRDQEALVNSISPDLASVYQGAKSIVAQRKGLEEGLEIALAELLYRRSKTCSD